VALKTYNQLVLGTRAFVSQPFTASVCVTFVQPTKLQGRHLCVPAPAAGVEGGVWSELRHHERGDGVSAGEETAGPPRQARETEEATTTADRGRYKTEAGKGKRKAKGAGCFDYAYMRSFELLPTMLVCNFCVLQLYRSLRFTIRLHHGALLANLDRTTVFKDGPMIFI